MEASYSLIAERRIAARTLVRDFPAVPEHANKKLLYSLTKDDAPIGDISISRWRAAEPPHVLPPTKIKVSSTKEPFQYEPARSDEVAWHVNFANADLFCSYGGPFFAQDEVQVAEHPVLASLRLWLLSLQEPALAPTVREGIVATPVLIQNVTRRSRIDTAEIYGSRFGRASEEKIKAAVKLIEPPTYSNILAMEAPVGGKGAYTFGELSRIVQTAHCGFAAAKKKSEEKRAIIHTGHWGTGAYGGNKIVMSALQMLAAQLAGVDALIYHTIDAEDAFIEGLQVYQHVTRKSLFSRLMRSPGKDLPTTLREIEAMKFRWGSSDGN
jgi:hypothetical protein